MPQLKSSLDQARPASRRPMSSSISRRPSSSGKPNCSRRRSIAQAALDRSERNLQSAEQAVAGAQAAEDRARLAYQSNIGSENTAVAQARQQLALAKYNVEESVVRAPCDGYATNIQLVPGAVVSAAASVLPFVCERDESNARRGRRVLHAGPVSADQRGRLRRSRLPDVSGPGLPRKGPDHDRSRQPRTAERQRAVSGC